MKKPFSFLLSAALVCTVLIVLCGYSVCVHFSESKQLNQALDTLAGEEYQSAIISMYDISYFSADDFAFYLGHSPLKIDYTFKKAGDINTALETVLHSGNHITNIYICLDPLMLWKSAKKDINSLQSAFEDGLLAYADSYPEISFEILFSFPSMDYLASLKSSELDTYLTLHQQLINILGGRNNVILFYPGGQDWLILNPGNYESDFKTNEFITRQIFLLTFGAHNLQITPVSAPAMLERTRALIAAEKESPVRYPDLSGYDIVFIGDSIIGNYSGSTSIPGVVSHLSGASVFNCALGGVSASRPDPQSACFPSLADQFTSGQPHETEGTFSQGVQEYYAAGHNGKKLCFIINFGLNDYFGGYPPENPADKYDISTYAGAMRVGIGSLKTAYPDAVCIIMGPGRVTTFDNGTEITGADGGPLSDYNDLSSSLSEELGTLYFDLYNSFPDEGAGLDDILTDGVHYNEKGRFLLGRKIIFFLADTLL